VVQLALSCDRLRLSALHDPVERDRSAAELIIYRAYSYRFGAVHGASALSQYAASIWPGQAGRLPDSLGLCCSEQWRARNFVQIAIGEMRTAVNCGVG
jgi:hypothetical protein